MLLQSKTAWLKAENMAQTNTTETFSPVTEKNKYLLDVSMVLGFSKLAHLRLMKKESLGLGKALNQLHFNDGIIPKAACIQIKLLLKGIRVGIHNVSYERLTIFLSTKSHF